MVLNIVIDHHGSRVSDHDLEKFFKGMHVHHLGMYYANLMCVELLVYSSKKC